MKKINFGTDKLSVSFDAETLNFSATAGSRTFETVADEPFFTVGENKILFSSAKNKKVEEYPCALGDGVLVTLSGFENTTFSFSLYLWVAVADSHLHAEFIPLTEGENVKEVAWPQPISSFDKENGYSVICLKNGKIFYDNSSEDFENISNRKMLSHEAYMPFWGQVAFGGGYIAIIDTPFDAEYFYKHPAFSQTKIGARWIPTLGKMDYRRTVSYAFIENNANYVSICKLYRDDVKKRGMLSTLIEKEARNPKLKEMYGRAIIHTPFICKHIEPSSDLYEKETPERRDYVITFNEMASRIEGLKARGLDSAYVHVDGWVKGGYDNLHPDAVPPNEKAGGYNGMRDMINRIRAVGYIPAIHDNYRDYYFTAGQFNKNQAKIDINGVYEDCHTWDGGNQLIVCPQLSPEYLKRNFTALKENGCLPDGAYLDVFSIVELDECANPMHRSTRKECFEKRAECFEYVRSLGLIVSSEEPTDRFVTHLDLVHHAPDWWGEPKGVAVPLFELVYHDCVIIPNVTEAGTWDWPKDRCGALYALLQGNPPYVSIDADEKEIKNASVIRKLNKEVATCEMTSHKLLDLNGVKQESKFACGTTVTVDFSDNSYKIVWKDGTETEGKID